MAAALGKALIEQISLASQPVQVGRAGLALINVLSERWLQRSSVQLQKPGAV